VTLIVVPILKIPPKAGCESVPFTACHGIFKQSVGARKIVGIELSYWHAQLHRLAVLIPWNRFLGSIKNK
jgi:hypothetical protein